MFFLVNGKPEQYLVGSCIIGDKIYLNPINLYFYNIHNKNRPKFRYAHFFLGLIVKSLNEPLYF